MTPAKALAPAQTKWFESLPWATLADMAVPLAVLAIVIALITPLPKFMLDLLIVSDILMSLTVMMVALYIIRPIEFTSFPTTLLLLTLWAMFLRRERNRRVARS